MKAIVIATVHGRCLPVMMSSIKHYVPSDVVVYISAPKGLIPTLPQNQECILIENTGTNFGDSYNEVVHRAFEDFDEIIVANDDIVLKPDSYSQLEQDLNIIKQQFKNIGWVVCKSDYVRTVQSIVHNNEANIVKVQRTSPIFGYVSKEAWVDFPPINWYSDDIQCIDMITKGYEHFVTRCYVHHVGSATITQNHHKNHLDAESWIKANRPELHGVWYK